jgi:hypothetical protein
LRDLSRIRSREHALEEESRRDGSVASRHASNSRAKRGLTGWLYSIMSLNHVIIIQIMYNHVVTYVCQIVISSAWCRHARSTRCASSLIACKGSGNRHRRLVALLVGAPLLTHGGKLSRRGLAALVATRLHVVQPGRALLAGKLLCIWIWGHVGGVSAGTSEAAVPRLHKYPCINMGAVERLAAE